MRYLILLFITIFFFPSHSLIKAKRSNTYLSFPIKKDHMSEKSFYLYRALITGNKKNINRQLSKTLKGYGSMHLMTPSGIHLSSLFFIKYLPHVIQQLILLFSMFYLIPLGAYNSLERVIIFKSLSLKFSFFSKVPNELKLIIVMTLAVLMGHYFNNPLSISLSFLFWGTIILFKNNPIKLMFYLFFSLLFINGLFGIPTKVSAIFINPILTSLLTLIFPVLTINLLLPEFIQMKYFISITLDFFINIVHFLNKYDQSPIIYINSFSLFICAALLRKHIKTSIFIILLMVTTNTPVKLSTYYPKEIRIPKSHLNGTVEGRNIYIGNLKCKRTNYFKIYCK